MIWGAVERLPLIWFMQDEYVRDVEDAVSLSRHAKLRYGSKIFQCQGERAELVPFLEKLLGRACDCLTQGGATGASLIITAYSVMKA